MAVVAPVDDDFGILVHSGWDRRRALLFNVLSALFNVLSALTFLAGNVAAYGLSGRLDRAVLVPFAAGTFVDIAAADLLPELITTVGWRDKVVHTPA
jgi:zinc and cadmium transporter